MLQVRQCEDLVNVHLRHISGRYTTILSKPVTDRLLNQQQVFSAFMVIDSVHNVLVSKNMRHYDKQPPQSQVRIRISQTRDQHTNEIRFYEVLILKVNVGACV